MRIYILYIIQSCMTHNMLTATRTYTYNFMMLLLLNESIRQLHWKCEYKVKKKKNWLLYVKIVVGENSEAEDGNNLPSVLMIAHKIRLMKK